MVNERKSVGIDINVELSNAFSEQLEERGYIKYRAVEGAIRAFMALPPELQVEIMSKPNNDIYEILTVAFRDKDAQDFLSSLKPADRKKVLALAKEALKSVSQRKKAPQ